jgi:Ca2+-transporting ATPase
MVNNWHNLQVDEVLKDIKSRETGLKKSEYLARFHKNGPNEIKKIKSISKLSIFLSQFKSFIIAILIIAIFISAAIGEIVDAIVILIIVLLNSIIGFFQEFKAEKSLAALRKMSAFKAKVIRNNKTIVINSSQIVIGDIIILEAGDKVPADARLIEVSRIEIDESALTGESLPVKKNLRIQNKEVVIADRKNMVYSGTIVNKGFAKAVVISTGMKTEFGKIAQLVQETNIEQTPLQKKIGHFGEMMGMIILLICAVIFLIGIFRGNGTLIDTFMISIALAVAAIPEGLPAVVTICLALGVERMVKKNALIRRLPSVETLGSCDIICTDKTGTLTYNKMTVRELFTNNQTLHVTGQGYNPIGNIVNKNNKQAKNIKELIYCAKFCNDSELIHKGNDWNIVGDPTEGSLIVLAEKSHLRIKKDDFSSQDSIPFDSSRKMMTVIGKINGNNRSYTKGAPDKILPNCNRILINGKVKKLTKEDIKNISKQNKNMASKGLRILAVSYSNFVSKSKTTNLALNEKKYEKNMIFIGLIGMNDPPRLEVKDSISECKTAGIRVIMITGDHKDTAVAIAKELGIGTSVMTGEELDCEKSITRIVGTVDIFARVNPEHKLKIVKAIKEMNHVVAMTGDGVNDAPALKKADIGIAMGITGTDVSKEASDMILTDDNFTSIVSAVKEGRRIFENIRKFIRYMITSNTGEVLTVFFAMMIGYVSLESGSLIMPLLAIHLLWINLLTDGFNAIALGLEKSGPNIMKHKPTKTNIIDSKFIIDTVITGFIMCIGTLWLFNRSLLVSDFYAQTMAFTVLVIFQFFNVFICRSENNSIFSSRLFSNFWLWLSILASTVLHFVVLYTPLSRIFKVVPLTLADWGLILLVASSLVIIMELKKYITRFVHNKFHIYKD